MGAAARKLTEREKTVNKQTLDGQIGQAGGRLVRLQGDLGRAKGDLNGATRNRTTGGVLLLIGAISLIGYLALGTQCTAPIAAIGLGIGGLMLIIALVKISRAHHAIDTISTGVTDARAELDGLKGG